MRYKKMNKVRFEFHFVVVKFYSSIMNLLYEKMNLLYEKCNEHIAKAEKILEDLERYGA